MVVAAVKTPTSVSTPVATPTSNSTTSMLDDGDTLQAPMVMVPSTTFGVEYVLYLSIYSYFRLLMPRTGNNPQSLKFRRPIEVSEKNNPSFFVSILIINFFSSRTSES